MLSACELSCVDVCTLIVQQGTDHISFAPIPVATALGRQSLYKIEHWLWIATPDLMSIDAAL